MKNNCITFLIKALLISACWLIGAPIQAATVLAASVHPVSEYTRITIETDQPVKYSLLALKSPSRVVLDLKNIPLNSQLKNLTTKNLYDDPYIMHLRVAKFKQDITRVVLDLKSEVNTTITILKPTVEYKYRLVLDIHPLHKAQVAEESGFDSSATSEANAAETETNNSNNNGTGIVLAPNPVFEPEVESPSAVE
jgi:N-acetylmuramoyl-L-alanine amidase